MRSRVERVGGGVGVGAVGAHSSGIEADVVDTISKEISRGPLAAN